MVPEKIAKRTCAVGLTVNGKKVSTAPLGFAVISVTSFQQDMYVGRKRMNVTLQNTVMGSRGFVQMTITSRMEPHAGMGAFASKRDADPGLCSARPFLGVEPRRLLPSVTMPLTW